MIDIDKYEGHIQGEWRDTRHEGALAHHIVAYNPQITYANDAGDVKICTVEPNEATANLVADAPLLLAEVKRLREEKDILRCMRRDGIDTSAHDNLLSEIRRLREGIKQLIVKVEGMSTGYRKPIVKVLKEMID